MVVPWIGAGAWTSVRLWMDTALGCAFWVRISDRWQSCAVASPAVRSGETFSRASSEAAECKACVLQVDPSFHMASISSIRISMNQISNIFDITVARIVHLINCSICFNLSHSQTVFHNWKDVMRCDEFKIWRAPSLFCFLVLQASPVCVAWTLWMVLVQGGCSYLLH